jgi:tetratricopeptide (TPR) repeat protein
MRSMIRVLTAAMLVAGLVGAALAQGVRSEVGKPLQQASDLLKAGKAKEALAKVREAEAIGGKTATEQLMIDRMKGSAAQRAGDSATAIAAFESAMASQHLSTAEQAQVAESLAFAYSQQKNWAKTTEWINRARAVGANSAQLNQLSAYVQSQSGDYAQIFKEAQAQVDAAEAAGRRPAEDDLLRMADAAKRVNNHGAYSHALDSLVLNYPKKEYWSAHLASIQRKPGFADRLSLDVMRLKFANGLIGKTDEYMEMTQLALQAGLPVEARTIVDKGFATGALGTGEQAERHKRLKDLVLKQQAESATSIAQEAIDAGARKDGNELVKVGTVYASMGQFDKAIELIEKGIAKGNLKHPEDAKLRLGLAMAQSPKSRAKGLQMLRTVTGNDGTSDVAKLYAVVVQQQG